MMQYENQVVIVSYKAKQSSENSNAANWTPHGYKSTATYIVHKCMATYARAKVNVMQILPSHNSVIGRRYRWPKKSFSHCQLHSEKFRISARDVKNLLQIQHRGSFAIRATIAARTRLTLYRETQHNINSFNLRRRPSCPLDCKITKGQSDNV